MTNFNDVIVKFNKQVLNTVFQNITGQCITVQVIPELYRTMHYHSDDTRTLQDNTPCYYNLMRYFVQMCVEEIYIDCKHAGMEISKNVISRKIMDDGASRKQSTRVDSHKTFNRHKLSFHQWPQHAPSEIKRYNEIK